MSRHEYIYGSGYPDHVRKPVISYTPGHGAHSYVTTIEAYVEEIRGPGPTSSSYTSNSSYKSNHGRPREVDELLTKILTEVNGRPPSPPSARTANPSWGTNWDRRSFPVKVEYRNKDPPPKVGPTRDYTYGSSPRKPEDLVDYGVPGYDHHPPERDYVVSTKVDPTRGYGSTHKYGGPPMKSEGPISYGAPQGQWDRPSGRDYDHPSQSAPYNQWGGSSMKPQTVVRDYDIPDKNRSKSPVKSQPRWGRLSSPVYDQPLENRSPVKSNPPKSLGVSEKRWGSPPSKSQAPMGYGAPNNQWERSSGPFHKDPHSPSAKSQAPMGYGAPNNQWERSSGSFNKDPHSPLAKSQAPMGYGAPNNQWERSSGSFHKDPHSPSAKSQAPMGYGAPNNQWERSSGSFHKDPHSPSAKSQAPMGYGAPNNHWGRSSGPFHNDSRKNPSPIKFDTPKDHGAPWRSRSSSPVYDHPSNDNHSPLNSNPVKTHGASEKRWGSPPSKSQAPMSYGAPNNQSPIKSETLKDHGAPLTNRWGSSPMKTGGYGAPDNQWRSRSSSPDHGHQQPPNVTCEDGVCTYNDKPEVNHGGSFPISKPDSQSKDYGSPYSYDGSSNRVKPSGSHPDSYSQTVAPLGKVTNNIGDGLEQLTISEGVLPEGATASRSLSSGPTTNLTGPWPKHTGPDRFGPKKETVAGPVDVDSREAMRRYGGHDSPSRPYSGREDHSRTITSKEALQKYNGSVVPK